MDATTKVTERLSRPRSVLPLLPPDHTGLARPRVCQATPQGESELAGTRRSLQKGRSHSSHVELTSALISVVTLMLGKIVSPPVVLVVPVLMQSSNTSSRAGFFRSASLSVSPTCFTTISAFSRTLNWPTTARNPSSSTSLQALPGVHCMPPAPSSTNDASLRIIP